VLKLQAIHNLNPEVECRHFRVRPVKPSMLMPILQADCSGNFPVPAAQRRLDFTSHRFLKPSPGSITIVL
jgi:hypothetical protein